MDNWFPVSCQLHWALRAGATEKGHILSNRPTLFASHSSQHHFNKITMNYSGYDC